MDNETMAYMESLLSSLQTGLSNMKAGSTTEAGYMLEKLNAMQRILQPESEITNTLRRLIWMHECAVRDYAYARGLRNGLNGSGRFTIDPDTAILDLAREADEAEAELNKFIKTLELG